MSADLYQIKQYIADLASSDSDVQLRAENALIRTGGSAVELLVEATAHPNAQVRWRAAWALGQIGDAQAFPAVRALLADPEDDVRHEAREAIGHLGDQRGIGPLVEVLRNADSNGWEAMHASHYIAMFGAAAVPALAEVLRTGTTEARRAAAYALGNSRAWEAIEPLAEFLGDPTLRHDVAVALGKLGDARSLDALVESARTGEEAGHDGDAWWALRRLGEAAVGPLREIARTGSTKARQQARRTLRGVKNADN